MLPAVSQYPAMYTIARCHVVDELFCRLRDLLSGPLNGNCQFAQLWVRLQYWQFQQPGDLTGHVFQGVFTGAKALESNDQRLQTAAYLGLGFKQSLEIFDR